MRALALATFVLAAGCLTAPGGSGADDGEWLFGGAWTTEYTQADIEAWCEIAKEYGNECLVMESYPPQYAMRFTNEATCNEARAKVLALDHISARECDKIVPATNPNEPTSIGPRGA